MAEHASLPPIWKALADAPNQQTLTTLYHVFNNTSRWLNVRTPIVATPGLLNIALTLGFRLNLKENLEMWLHQLYLGKHTSAARKLLNAHVDQRQVIAGGSGAPTLDDTAYLTATDGVALPETLAVSKSTHAQVRVILDTLLGRDNPVSQVMDMIIFALMYRETELYEYSPCEH